MPISSIQENPGIDAGILCYWCGNEWINEAMSDTSKLNRHQEYKQMCRECYEKEMSGKVSPMTLKKLKKTKEADCE